MTKQDKINTDKLGYIVLLEESQKLIDTLNHDNGNFVSDVVKELITGKATDAQLFRQALAEIVVDKLKATNELVSNELKRIEIYEKHKGD